MDNRKDRERNGLVVLILGVATVLVALIGASFAFFSATIKEISKQSVEVGTAEIVGVTYESDGPVTLTDAIPGAQDTSTFSVTNENVTASATYGLNFVPVTNDFEDTEGEEQLLITISGGALTEPVVLNYTNGNTDKALIKNGIEIDADTTHDYTIKVDFVETGEEQNTNQKKTFIGYVEVFGATYSLDEDYNNN